MNQKLVAILGSYARAAVAAVLALYLAGETNLKTLALAALTGVAGPLLKALDSSDPAYGRGAE
jgi:uncharacterized membrane protein YgaE (UPF0421/DUF939 family)